MAKLTPEQKAKFSRVGKSNVATAKSHERRVAKLLSEWSGVQFRRRRVEGRGDDVKVVEGVADVIPVQGDIYFAIEAKKGKGFSLDALMANPSTAKFTSWWHQASYDAKLMTDDCGQARYPMLFFKPQPAWDWIAIPQEVPLYKSGENHSSTIDSWTSDLWFPHLAFNGYNTIGSVEMDVSHSKKNPVIVALELSNCYLCRWKDFAVNVDPRSMFIQI